MAFPGLSHTSVHPETLVQVAKLLILTCGEKLIFCVEQQAFFSRLVGIQRIDSTGLLQLACIGQHPMVQDATASALSEERVRCVDNCQTEINGPELGEHGVNETRQTSHKLPSK